MSAILEPVPASSRRERLEAYAAYLAERDGEPDFARRTLPRREISATAFETTPLRYDGPFSVPTFDAQHRRYDRRRPTPDEVLLLLVFAKINANEAYGVELVTQRPLHGDELSVRLQRLVLLEERYHTRLLLSATVIFGAHVTEPALPVPITRAVVKGVADLPEVASRPMLLAGEVIGILTFLRLIGTVRRVFRGHPEVRDALEERVTEVLIDEIGHLSLNRLLATTGTFAALRLLLPLLALGTRGALPEAASLGILPLPVRDVLSFDVRALPEEVRARAFVA